jgi:hypothetical protein
LTEPGAIERALAPGLIEAATPAILQLLREAGAQQHEHEEE